MFIEKIHVNIETLKMFSSIWNSELNDTIDIFPLKPDTKIHTKFEINVLVSKNGTEVKKKDSIGEEKKNDR